MKKKQLKSLYDICSYTRAAGSQGELAMIAKHIEPIADYRDDYGNYYKRIGSAPVIWSSHTDTVHRESDPTKQTIYIDSTESRLFKGKDKMCLGADCGTGVWLMLQMIKANIAGLYIFHRAEEIGGQGSHWIVEHPEASTDTDYEHWLQQYTQCIAFDRYGTTSIITHQGAERTCSDDYAYDLAGVLGMDYGLDDGGSFTDSKSYSRLIPECTNISVGYYDQHSNAEYQDLNHLLKLADVLCTRGNEIGKLAPYRDPSKIEMIKYDWGKFSAKDLSLYDYRDYRDADPLVDAIMEYPDVVAEMLREGNSYQMDDEELARLIEERFDYRHHYSSAL